MKPSRNIHMTPQLLLLAGLLSTTVTPALAGGLFGGGESDLDLLNRPRLRELIDKTPCQWISGEAFFSRVKEAHTALAALDEVHWYFADSLAREARSLKVCLTANLLRIPTDDEDGLTIARLNGRAQLAIRLRDMIFVDKKLFEKMPERDQGLLLIHEAMHGFIPMDAERRNEKLRSMVATIARNMDARLSAEDMQLAIDMNEISLAGSIQDYALLKDTFRTLLNVSAPLSMRVQALNEVTTDQFSLLLPGDWAVAQNLIAATYGAASQAIRERNFEAFKNAIDLGCRLNSKLLSEAVQWGDNRFIGFVLDRALAEVDATLVMRRVLAGEITLTQAAQQDQLMARADSSLALYALEHSRYDMAVRLIRAKNARMDSTTAHSLVLFMIRNPDPRNFRIFDLLLRLDRLPLDAQYDEEGHGLLVTLLQAKLQSYAVALLQDPRVDVNADGALNIALDFGLTRAAGEIVSHPRFVFTGLTQDTASETHDRALKLLDVFVQANHVKAVRSLVDAYPRFTWFELHKYAESRVFVQFNPGEPRNSPA